MHSQSFQNSKLQCLYNISKKKLDKVDFLHAGKHQSFLQGDTIIIDGMVEHSQCIQSNKSAMSLQYLKKKKLGMEFISLHAD